MFPQIKPAKKTIYLDYAASTPIDPLVKKVMEPFLGAKFGNPSSLYKQGREARLALEEARKKIAEIIGARAGEIVLTAGGTESVNLAIFGLVGNNSFFKKRMNTDNRTDEHGYQEGYKHFITTTIEHHAVLKCFEELERRGHKVTYLKVDAEGFVKLDELKKAVRPNTVLVSVMYANNEVGTIEPIEQVSKLIKRMNTDRLRHGLTRILLHTDACQAAGALNINVNRLGVDLMTVNGSKIYGPKQTGFLYVRTGVQLQPIIYGGGQERNLRSGTENVPGVVGLAKALELAEKNKAKENLRLQKLRDYFTKQVLKISGVELNGPDFTKVTSGKPLSRLPNNINVSFRGLEGEALMLYLDGYNIAVSTGSACATSQTDPSHVIMALGKSALQAQSSIRMTLGKFTTKTELDYVLKVLPGVVKELRKIN